VNSGEGIVTPLESIRSAFEGVMPAVIATCSADGTPNIGYLSQVSYVDSTHVALSFQFFNKTHRYLTENSRACVQLIEPMSMQHYQLDLVFEQTQTEGPVFDKMRVKLDAVAALTGMTGIFKLQGADVFRVLSCRPVPNNLITRSD
jgi:adenylate cyclase